MTTNYWGYHLIVDARAGHIASVQSADTVSAFAKELVKRIDMVAYGEPQVVRFGSGELAGITLVQLIETSNICAHFVDQNGDFYLDVFSCKEFDPEDVLQCVREFFAPENMKTQYFTRQA